jgi:uncharacterized protein YndB with AHSA1/START domain
MREGAMRLGIGIVVALLGVGAARGEVKQSAPDGLLVAHVVEVKRAPAEVFAALGRVGEWWNGEHSWSHEAKNLSLELRAGGCFCERWATGSAEHGRVVQVREGELLRLAAMLGPLQELAATGALTFALAPLDGGRTRLTVSYRVNGDSASGFDRLAPIVDGVIGEQVGRLVRFVETGKPEAPPAS